MTDDALDVIEEEEEATPRDSGLAGSGVDEARKACGQGLSTACQGDPSHYMGTVTAFLFRQYEPLISTGSILQSLLLITGTALPEMPRRRYQSLAVAIRKIRLHGEEQSFWKVLVQRDNRSWYRIDLVVVFGIVSLWLGNIVLGGIISLRYSASDFHVAIDRDLYSFALEKFNFDPSIAQTDHFY